MPSVNVMIKPASGLCNLRCSYCFYANEMANRSQASFGIMTAATMENVVREVLAFADRQCTFVFQGGEPTLAGLEYFRRFLQLENQYNTKKIRVSHAIQTNGYILDDEWCRFLKENHFLVGLSLDGVRPAHDAYRKDASGKDTYFHTLNTAELLKKHQVDFNILTVVHAGTAARIRKIYDHYLKMGFRWQQYIACLDPMGEEQGRQDYSLTPEAYGQFLIELFSCWYEDARKGKAPYIRQFDNYISILQGELPESCEQRGACSAQHVVEADGSVYPCDFYVLDEYCMGNLNTDSLQTIHQRIRESEFLKKSRNQTEECQRCRWFAVCRGGCRRHREQPGTPPGENIFCKGYKVFFETCIDKLMELARM